jgi:hypothetical protein
MKKMARIKIKDLPQDQEITKEELKKHFGGGLWYAATDMATSYSTSSTNQWKYALQTMSEAQSSTIFNLANLTNI